MILKISSPPLDSESRKYLNWKWLGGKKSQFELEILDDLVRQKREIPNE